MLGRGTFALVERSMRVETRLARTHLIRLGFAVLILLFLVQVQVQIEKFSTPGRDVFQNICWVNFFLLSLAGMSFFSTVITEEKEEMTLGLLRMAGISPVGILLGKVTPRLLGAILLLSVQLPFTFLAITLGGVAINQILAAYVALLAFAVMLSGLGAFLSTVCPRSNVAASLATAVLALLYVVPHLCYEATSRLSRQKWITGATRSQLDDLVGFVERSTPLGSLNTILATNFAGSMLSYQVVVNLVAGAAFFVGAWILFDACTRNDSRSAPSRGLMALFSKRLTTESRVWQNALAWKDFNFLTGGLTAVAIKFLAYAVLMGGMSILIARSVRTEEMDSIGGTLMLSMLTALAVEVPIYLSRVFREELRWQTWPGLYLLPESVRRIAVNKLLGVSPTFLPAVAIFFTGAFIAPRFLEDLGEKLFLEIEGWYVMTQYVLVVHVIVLMSLIVKWGALPFGISIVVVPNLVFYFAVGLRGPDTLLAVPIGLAVVLCGVAQYLILGRLRVLAAQ